MRVVMPMTRVCHLALDALWEFAPDAEFADVSENDEAYFRLLRHLWDNAATFALVEHDIEVSSTTLQDFEDCEEPWCVFPYEGRPYKHYPVPVLRCALGCVRFRADFLKTNAGIFDQHPFDVPRLRHWRRLDSQLASVLQRRGFRAHEHEPHVKHWHDYENDPATRVYEGWIPAGG